MLDVMELRQERMRSAEGCLVRESRRDAEETEVRVATELLRPRSFLVMAELVSHDDWRFWYAQSWRKILMLPV